MNWHSQGSIIYGTAMIHFLDTNDRKEIAVPNYNYKIGEMDGKDMRSNRKMEIKELKKDDMEVNNEKNINKFGIFNYFNSLCIN